MDVPASFLVSIPHVLSSQHWKTGGRCLRRRTFCKTVLNVKVQPIHKISPKLDFDGKNSVGRGSIHFLSCVVAKTTHSMYINTE